MDSKYTIKFKCVSYISKKIIIRIKLKLARLNAYRSILFQNTIAWNPMMIIKSQVVLVLKKRTCEILYI